MITKRKRMNNVGWHLGGGRGGRVPPGEKDQPDLMSASGLH